MRSQGEWMMDYRQALAQLEQNADAVARKVVAAWQTRAEEVLGEKLPPELDLDSLPDLIRTLAAAAPEGPEHPAASDMIRTAIEHGKHRRREGYDDAILFREYHLLRRFLWDELKESGVSQDALVGAILHIDAAMTAATSGSIHGFHLVDHPADQEALVRRLVADWNVPLR